MTVVDPIDVEESLRFCAVWLSRPGRWLEEDDLDTTIEHFQSSVYHSATSGGGYSTNAWNRCCTFACAGDATMALRDVARSMARIGMGPPEAEIVSFRGHSTHPQTWVEVGRSKWEGRP